MKVIILAGGKGTRLWPESREHYPKQFLKLFHNKSFFALTVERFLGYVRPEDILVITNKNYYFLIKKELEDLNIDNKVHVIKEPQGKNTAPAIIFGIKYIQEKMKAKDDEIVFVSPSDHIISPKGRFIDYLEYAKNLANNYIITFGITPTAPETGYGYIKTGKKIDSSAYYIEKFTEKPDIDTAIEYVATGEYFWNSGMFMFSVKKIVNDYKKYAPKIFNVYKRYNFEKLIEHFDEFESISIDYAIMEKTKDSVIIPMSLTWSDIGSWDSLYKVMDKDKNSNVKIGENIITIDTKESLIVNKNINYKNKVIAAVGISNINIIDTDDALLILKEGESQKVREVVEVLKNKNLVQGTDHIFSYRPWGFFVVLSEGEGYKIKTIVVKPHQKLSLQLHYHRSEFWVVVRGKGKAQVGDDILDLDIKHQVSIPKETKHRLENPYDEELEIIEVQIGDYLGEDDIVRFEDIYGRV